MDENLSNETSQEALDSIKNNAQELGKQIGSRATRGIAQKGRKLVGNAAKKLGKLAIKLVKTILKALLKLLLAMGWVGLAGIVAAAIILGIFIHEQEQRGAREEYTQDIAYENPTQQLEDGLDHALALTEPQAVIDAYYKYMSSASYEKHYNGKSYHLHEDDETQDFAGLADYFQRENYFYLSSSFLKMADELFHNNEFCYPEQFIKPVYYEESGGKVKAQPLIEHHDEDGTPSEILVTSKRYAEDTSTDYPYDYTTQTNEEVPCVWDWGFGSVISYQPEQKDVYINCQYSSFDIDIDEYYWVEIPPVDEDDEPSWEKLSRHSRVVSIPVFPSSTAASLQAAIDEYNEPATDEGGEPWEYVAVQPSTSILSKLCDEDYNKRIPQKVDTLDMQIAKRDFNDSNLKVFSNVGSNKPSPVNPVLDPNGTYYPLNIPIINSVAAMSGSIEYVYNGVDITENELAAGSGLPADAGIITDESKFGNYEDNVTDVLVGAGCNQNLFAIRSGNICTELPKLEEEVDDPWGFNYIDDYASIYQAVVPINVVEDNNFFKRLGRKEVSPGHYEYKSDTWDVMKEMGLMHEYTGGSLSRIEGLNVNLSDLEVMARLICAEAGHNMLDELMVGAVLVDRYYYYNTVKNTPTSYLDLVAAPGQYQCYSNGSFMTAQPSERDYKAAELVLNGEFALPWNVFYQAGNQLGVLFLMNPNNAAAYEYPHYYCFIDGESTARGTDPFGRPAKTAEQIQDWVKELIAMYGGETEGSTMATAALSLDNAYTGEGANSVVNIDSDYKLYDIRTFDVLAATSNLQKITEDGPKSFGAKIQQILDGIADILDQLKKLTESINETFGIRKPDGYFLFNEAANAQDARDAVYQAITFSNSASYNEVVAKLENSEDLSFLFVGKEAGLGIGTMNGMWKPIPSTATTIDGFVSPTSQYYPPSTTYSASTPYSVISAPSGTAAQAVYGGTVVSVNYDSAPKGTNVVVRHTDGDGNTYEVIYGGLSNVNVSAGSTVSVRQTLGTVGSDGLYFEVRVNGTLQDPLSMFYQSAYGNDAIVSVARAEIGNVGGAKYKQWYGLSMSDNWCAAFCSWCAAQLGYIDSHVFPKFASCGECIQGQLLPNNVYVPSGYSGFTPAPGNLIFFDWSGIGHFVYNNPGAQRHVGIVERVENGIVYTIEGNSGGHGATSSLVRQKSYALNSKFIIGYANLDFTTPLF